jgi:cytochrome P450
MPLADWDVGKGQAQSLHFNPRPDPEPGYDYYHQAYDRGPTEFAFAGARVATGLHGVNDSPWRYKPYWATEAPLWMLLCLAAIAPLLWISMSVRRRRLARRGLCLRCGYDLRASPTRCPECGATPPSASPDLARRPPGPRSRMPGRVVFGLRHDVLAFLTRICRGFGDAVFFRAAGRNFFVFNHPDAIRDVLVTHDSSFIKGPALQRAKETLGEGLLTSEGDFHRRQRRLAQPAFHPNRVVTYGAAMAEITQRAAQGWRDGQRVDLHEEMMKVTLRIVARTLFAAEVGEEIDAIGKAMDISVGMFTRTMTPWGPLLNKLPLPANFRFRRARQRLFATLDRFIREHRESGDRGDLLSVLIRARDPEGDHGQMSETLLRDESYTIFTAGHETTANALTFALYLLARHPQAEAKLHEELDAILGGRPPTVEDTERLPYTRMVIAEAMRLYPPAWAVGREAAEDVQIGEYVIPNKSVVLLSQWVMHRDPRWYPEPERFDPLRWTDEERAKRPRWCYFPFGGGSRQCIGESFAWMEAILVLATVAQKWRVELLDVKPVEVFATITLRPKRGVPVILRALMP